MLHLINYFQAAIIVRMIIATTKKKANSMPLRIQLVTMGSSWSIESHTKTHVNKMRIVTAATKNALPKSVEILSTKKKKKTLRNAAHAIRIWDSH